jgi:hypothetical protein
VERIMNMQFVISVAVVFVMLMAFGTLVHAFLLKDDYGPLERSATTQVGLYRSRAEQIRNVPIMIPAHICAAIAIVWLYSQGPTAASWASQGLRFGLALAAVMPLHKFLVYYALQPLPGSVVVKQIAFDGIAAVLIGMVLAAVHR